MTQAEPAQRIDRIANEAFALLGTGRQVAPFSVRYPDFSLAEAYAVAMRICDLRSARGEIPVGRKIGFTNTTVWHGYGISGPIWSYMFDKTVSNLAEIDETFALAGLPEPRIEPEIVLHIARVPRIGMSEYELIQCVDWLAHGFEVVYSIFPGWKFSAEDAVAAYGVHGALLLGDRYSVSSNHAEWQEALANFTIEFAGNDGISVQGNGQNVLGGPLKALRFLVEELARFPACEPLRPGELITTGTLTEAMPASSGQRWATRFAGVDISGLRLRLR